ncbi:MAG: hypothetical protein M3290_08135, partial [Actinomycetota bacterium]|nr:hypothetical protein [Actinomycetota bacterium]
AQSAWWVDDIPVELKSLMECDVGDFDHYSREAMSRLHTSTPGSAAGGLVVFVRIREQMEAQLLCLKLKLSNLSLERFTGALSATAAITVEDIKDVLPKAKDLKKAALIPHPVKVSDLKVVDEQAQDAADYWLRFLGARVGVKEPDVGKLVALTTLPVLQEEGVQNADALMGNELKRVAAATKSEPVRSMVRHLAKEAGVEPNEVWKKVAEREPKLKDAGVSVSPAAAQRVITEIAVAGGVRVTGPSTSLDGGYEIIDNPNADGWILQIFTSEYPKVTHQVKRGPIAS